MSSKDRPVSHELEMLLPVLAETMKFATQALAQSTALSEVMIAKGLATKAELDAAMSSGRELKDELMKILNEQINKQS
jgi:hypothetical protein